MEYVDINILWSFRLIRNTIGTASMHTPLHYIRELLIAKSNISVAPIFSNLSIMIEESFWLTNADIATPMDIDI